MVTRFTNRPRLFARCKAGQTRYRVSGVHFLTDFYLPATGGRLHEIQRDRRTGRICRNRTLSYPSRGLALAYVNGYAGSRFAVV